MENNAMFKELFQKFQLKHFQLKDVVNKNRRNLVGRLLASAGLVAVGSNVVASESSTKKDAELRFPGDPADHRVVYQLNKPDESYHKAVLFSVGALVRKYGDNIKIVVVAIGPGLHVLAKKPKRPITKQTRQRVSSLEQYGVEFHACGNTMKALDWTMDDMLPFAKYVEVGAADLMELQAEGFSYISW